MITGIVLSGGLGRRMGGVDKGLQLFQGRPLVHWAITRFRPQVDRLLINANRHPEEYAALGYRVVGDAVPGFVGPLAGLHAALTIAADDLVASVPCDAPFLPTDLVARLLAGLISAEAMVAVARTPQRLQPVFTLCRREVLANLTAFLAGGGRKVGQWLATVPVAEVTFDDATAFENFNTPDQLADCAPGVH
ncbi:MAG TPA: molybdenum cofactor guanylyltransferase MobA [Accumulibacter sp.]|nr:molybdenum cofactor guanylyltransferase MobA [Accumulibacter sp.]HMX23368.1 molybdenum cofactor guanylyltransferase MobA [Accumulibacter sp.]HNC19038.1 molybdenum cofactor guanylyltransferase MobA [Accumulibacter sp.]HND79605.1 molybdenum cofactor guanylyltransferase MobA [Accumulibacter sp.]HNE14296.1 molybdenum cofactor guanylyltransferase MobA [Accumulibacter sp.]